MAQRSSKALFSELSTYDTDEKSWGGGTRRGGDGTAKAFQKSGVGGTCKVGAARGANAGTPYDTADKSGGGFTGKGGGGLVRGASTGAFYDTARKSSG
jgi:hypothetical protein